MNNKQASQVKDKVADLRGGLNSRQRQLILYGLGVLSVILIAVFVYRPLMIKLHKAQEKCHSLQTQLLIQRDNISVLKKLDLSARMMQQKEVSSAIDEITEQGRALGLKFISITPRQPRKLAQNNFQLLSIIFKIECAYKDLGEFLVFLEEFPRGIIAVESLSIQPKEAALPKLNLELVANFYLEPEDEK